MAKLKEKEKYLTKGYKIPETVFHRMETFEEINWSGFIRKEIERKLQELENQFHTI